MKPCFPQHASGISVENAAWVAGCGFGRSWLGEDGGQLQPAVCMHELGKLSSHTDLPMSPFLSSFLPPSVFSFLSFFLFLILSNSRGKMVHGSASQGAWSTGRAKPKGSDGKCRMGKF